jgi:hypothetical protein
MMNMIELQDKLKNFSQEQLVGMMQQPTGEAPQFMVLSEITRRQKMQQEASKTPTQSVAQEAVAAAGVPQGGIADMARTLAPQTNVAQNTGAMSAPPQGMPSAPQGIAQMASGGVIKMAEAGTIDNSVRRVYLMGTPFDVYLDGTIERIVGNNRVPINQNGGIPDRLRAIAIKQGLGYSPKTPEEAATLERIINTESDVVMPETGQPAAGSAQGLGSIPTGDSQYGGPDVYGNRGEDPYAPYYQEYLPTGQETTEPTVVTPPVVTPPYDPTSVDRNPPPARQVTPIDLNTYPAGKFGSPATVPLSPSELAAQEESRRRVEGYDRQFINDERNFPVPNEPIVFDVREGAPQTASQTAPQIPQSRADQEQRDLYAYNQAMAAMEANRKSNASGTEFDSITAMAANSDNKSATEALAGYFGNAIDPRLIGPTDGLALLEKKALARDAAGPTFVSPNIGNADAMQAQMQSELERRTAGSDFRAQEDALYGQRTPSNVGIMQDPTQVNQGEIPEFAQDIGGYFSDLWKKANDPSKINIAGYSDPNIVEIPALGAIDTETDTAPVVETTANTDTGTPLYAQEGFDPNNLVPKTKTSTGGGLNSGRYSDYQQQLIDMLDSRKDEAKSDKWMALAQAGMALMQGGTGSFGGDLGKAGQTGLAALQESNKSARQDRFGVLKTLADIDATNRSLQIQAQAASQKGILNPSAYISGYQKIIDQSQEIMDDLTIGGNAPAPGIASDQYEAALARRQAAQEELQRILPLSGAGANNKLAGNYNVTK